MEFWKRVTIRFCFFVFGLWHWNWPFLFKRENVLDKDFVRRFLIEQKHTYEELFTEINARYQNPKGCSLRSVKRFCNHQEIRKRMPVSDDRISAALDRNTPVDFPSEKSFLLFFGENWCRVVLNCCVNVIGRNACELAWLTKLTKVIGRRLLDNFRWNIRSIRTKPLWSATA